MSIAIKEIVGEINGRMAIDDRDLLCLFYQHIYCSEFPDKNERESLSNIFEYLRLKEGGWYGNNNYHVHIMHDDGKPVGGGISDYLADPNCGVIEFLVVDSSCRSKGLGTTLLNKVEDTLRQDASTRVGCSLDWIIAEMNDPFKTERKLDSMDSFARPLIWDKWGYRKMQFPYTQPGLDEAKKPVTNLLLMAKTFAPVYEFRVPSDKVRAAVHQYIQWAMRIPDPAQNRQFQDMASYLNLDSNVNLFSLREYVCRHERALHISSIDAEHRDDLEPALVVYAKSFPEGETTAPAEEFRIGIRTDRHTGKEYKYHLWAIRTEQSGPVCGMASFFTFPRIGFGGYVAFVPPLIGTGRLKEVIRARERAMIEDCMGAAGWFVECERDRGCSEVFKQCGFYEVDIDYRQPALFGNDSYDHDAAPRLCLLYKQFGDQYVSPVMKKLDFLTGISWIFRVVYRMSDPESSPYYQHIERQVARLEELPFL